MKSPSLSGEGLGVGSYSPAASCSFFKTKAILIQTCPANPEFPKSFQPPKRRLSQNLLHLCELHTSNQ